MSDTQWPAPAHDGNTVVPEGPFVDAVSVDRTGLVIGGYRLCALVGSGGMGEVWRAEHIKLGRQVALKMLHPRFAADSAAVARFFGEARAVNAIRHEHIIDVTDFLDFDEGRAYVMELLEGESLASAAASGQLALERVIDIMRQVADAMAAVHAASIVHRDLKPDNIFLTTRSGRRDFVKLLDFGVAKLHPKERAVETRAGSLMGTPEYMAPEQLVGKPLDHRADIYALGVILFELVMGRRPFQGATFGALVIQHTIGDVPPLEHVDEGVAQLIRACLEKDPAKRPQSMSDIVAALDVLHGVSSANPHATSAVAPSAATNERMAQTPGPLSIMPPPAIASSPPTAAPLAARPSRALVAGGIFAVIAVVVVTVALVSTASQAPTLNERASHSAPVPSESSVGTQASPYRSTTTAPSSTAPASFAAPETAAPKTIGVDTPAAQPSRDASKRGGADGTKSRATNASTNVSPPPTSTATSSKNAPVDGQRAVTLSPFGD